MHFMDTNVIKLSACRVMLNIDGANVEINLLA